MMDNLLIKKIQLKNGSIEQTYHLGVKAENIEGLESDSVITNLNNLIGDLGDLDTTAKTDLVSAINEVAGQGSSSPSVYVSVLLSASSWDGNNEQTVTVPGVSSDETAQLIQPVPASTSREAYDTAGVKATAQAANSLTFSCDDAPEVDLTVYVVITEVGT